MGIQESARVLKPGGHLVFTDIMQSDTCNLSQMAPVYKRIQLDDMGSPGKYREWAEKCGLEFVEFEDLTGELAKHYSTVRQVLLEKQASGELEGKVSGAYIEKMASGLQSWVDQAGNKNLAWGYMVFKKPLAARHAKLLGMGNPLLDISAEVDQKLMDKYELQAGNAILAEEKHQTLFGEMVKMPNVQYIAGGATQNSIRVAQWMLERAGATAYMGCIGKDENGQKLQEACGTDGVKTMYMVDPSTPTGVCATLITGIERSLCTNLNAANNYKVEHCKEAAQWQVVKDAKIVYSAGFFATVSPAAIKAVSQQKAKDGGIYCMNLSAPFLMQVPPFKAVFVETMPYVDFLFGNETEALTWAETEGWETTDIKFIATRLSLIPSAKSRKRTVVITQGCDPTIVCVGGQISEHPILALPKEKLVDTNGAGDSYVGGFLAGLVKGLPAEECCKAGAYAASVIVQQSGCTFPGKPDYKF